MELKRRELIGALGAAAALGAAGCAPGGRGTGSYGNLRAGDGWDRVRRQFLIDRDFVDLSAMLIASHPKMVRQAIARHRDEMDNNPVMYLQNNRRFTNASRAAAGAYLGIPGEDIAITDSTTMGIGLIYAGIALKPGDEVLTTDQDYYVTHESIRLACLKPGAVMRKIPIFESVDKASADEIVARVLSAITPKTRVVGLTWVHSSTGLKMPIAPICAQINNRNAARGADEQIITVIDGVHAFGIENMSFGSIGCDFLASGCHKWLFGPRGTGIVAGRGWERLSPTIPSFLDSTEFSAWYTSTEPEPGNAARLSPGGFKPFEHIWSLPEAFGLHMAIGKERVEARTRELATQLKEGLQKTPGIRLVTPMDPDLSSGIVSFDVEGQEPRAVTRMLREKKIIASTAPYAKPHVRLTPSIRNTPKEIDRALRELNALIS